MSATMPSPRDNPRLVRLRARLHRWRIDHELAGGCPPDTSPERAVRAHQLNDPLVRSELARGLRGAVAKAEAAVDQRLVSAAPLCTRAVRAHREALLGLAEQLEQPAYLNPCGVARVALLLTDGSGPLYNPEPPRTMSEAVWSIADGLQPCSPSAVAGPGARASPS